ncbi:hypothetical protein ACFE04_027739 [Oxalis oulophora]
MATNKFLTHILILNITIVLIFISSSLATDTNPNATVSQGTICQSTQDPSYCKSILPTQPSNVYAYGRFSVKKSLFQSQKFLALVENYLQKKSSSLSTSAIRALEDCHLLASLNIDYLSSSFQTVNKTSTVLLTETADYIQTLLSAIITNQQTCSESLLQASAYSSTGLSGDLLNDTKLYSVSLALFTKGWVPRIRKVPRKKKLHKKLFPFQNKRTMDRIHQSVKNRKLLQDSDEAVVFSDLVVVSQDGSGNFTTITDAINYAPNSTKYGNGYFLIYITAGVYEEYIEVDKKKTFLMLIGDGINQTIITGNRSVGDGWTTFNCATLIVTAANFTAASITFRNTAGPAKYQAVAVRSSADFSVFYKCSFEGYQDTLYTHTLRQVYSYCDIYGTVDFIFGNAAVVLQNCNIYPRLPMHGQYNTITAQGRTDPNQNTGTTIQACVVRPTPDLANSTVATYLGRPWKEYSRTVVMQTCLDGFIKPAGWHLWDGDFALSTLYYAEYNNTGAGSNTSQRVTWPGYRPNINSTDAVNYTVANFLVGDAWLPDTGIIYTSYLV